MNQVFNPTESANRLSDLRNSGPDNCDKESLKNLMDLDLVSYAFPGRIDKYLDDVVNPYLFRVDDVTVKMEFNCEGQKLSATLSRICDFH